MSNLQVKFPLSSMAQMTSSSACSSPLSFAVRVNNLQHHRRRHATCYHVDANDEEHGGNQLAAVLLQETDDGIEDAVEMLKKPRKAPQKALLSILG